MCGIVGYIGNRNVEKVLIKGLKRLEYRGYDSAGIGVIRNGQQSGSNQLAVFKKKGKVSDLEKLLKNHDLSKSTIGIGHTRWATHGAPNDVNAHPHFSSDGKLAMIHNGIIENYNAIKSDLSSQGHVFKSETDSEVFIHFIENIQRLGGYNLEEAVRIALSKVIGAYAIVILSEDEPRKLIAARKGSPLVIGVGENQSEFFLASDATPIIEYTKDVVFLNDGEMAIITDGELKVKSTVDVTITPYIETLDIELETIEKGGFDHFMLKEIFEQPRSIKDCLRGRLILAEKHLSLGGIRHHLADLIKAPRIIFVGCGTSWHAGLVAEYMFEEWARTPVEVEYASEFRYRNPIIRKGDVVIAISQSGETADTIAAMEIAKEKGAIVLGVCNVVGSTISRISDEGVYTHAGPEIGVASTKAFTAQLTVLAMIGLIVARKKETISQIQFEELLHNLEAIPAKVEKVMAVNEKVEKIAAIYKNATNFLYLGRGYNFPVALEGALKLKEISYIHAEGYPAAEMKHGPIALIDEAMPVVFIATRDSSYDKIVSNIQEVRARGGKVIAIVSEGDALIPKMVDYFIEVPAVHESLTPLISVIPLQLLSYHIALMRGCNVDQPRNLAKSVTVE